jgi:hypothetical protein
LGAGVEGKDTKERDDEEVHFGCVRWFEREEKNSMSERSI